MRPTSGRRTRAVPHRPAGRARLWAAPHSAAGAPDRGLVAGADAWLGEAPSGGRPSRHVAVAHLPHGMHPRVRASGHGHPHAHLGGHPQHRPKRSLELALHRAQTGLAGPAVEVGAVVADVQAQTQQPAGAGLLQRSGGLLVLRLRSRLVGVGRLLGVRRVRRGSSATSTGLGSRRDGLDRGLSRGSTDSAGLDGLDLLAEPGRGRLAASLAARRVAAVASATVCSARGSHSSITAMGALSPLRGPILVMRV